MNDGEDALHEGLGNHYDVAVVEELHLARYLAELKRGACRTIFDAHNLESALSSEMTASARGNGDSGPLGKWKRNLLDRRLVTAEKGFALASDRIWTCSTVDQEGFSSLIGNSRPIDVIPNSIDVPAYAQADRCHEAEDWRNEPLLLTYLGTDPGCPAASQRARNPGESPVGRCQSHCGDEGRWSRSRGC